MCEALGYEVFKLRRVRIMNISLDGIPNGKWRYLTEAEVAEILAMCEASSGTEEASRVDSQGQRIRKATDAKLFDSREENQPSKARRNPKTFRGHNADEFRHAPNSKKGKTRSERPDSSRADNRADRKPKSTGFHHSGKPASAGKPAAARQGGTLRLKK